MQLGNTPPSRRACGTSPSRAPLTQVQDELARGRAVCTPLQGTSSGRQHATSIVRHESRLKPLALRIPPHSLCTEPGGHADVPVDGLMSLSESQAWSRGYSPFKKGHFRDTLALTSLCFFGQLGLDPQQHRGLRAAPSADCTKRFYHDHAAICHGDGLGERRRHRIAAGHPRAEVGHPSRTVQPGDACARAG